MLTDYENHGLDKLVVSAGITVYLTEQPNHWPFAVSVMPNVHFDVTRAPSFIVHRHYGFVEYDREHYEHHERINWDALLKVVAKQYFDRSESHPAIDIITRFILPDEIYTGAHGSNRDTLGNAYPYPGVTLVPLHKTKPKHYGATRLVVFEGMQPMQEFLVTGLVAPQNESRPEYAQLEHPHTNGLVGLLQEDHGMAREFFRDVINNTDAINPTEYEQFGLMLVCGDLHVKL